MKRAALVLVTVLVLGAAAGADTRYYAWTYQFAILQPDEVEIEFYNKFTRDDVNDSLTDKWKRQFEIEAGIFEWAQAAVYAVESYRAGTGVQKFDELKFQVKIKLVESKDDFIMDPMFYAEYKLQADRSYPDKWEFKLIFAKDMGDLNISFNYIPEEAYINGKKAKYWKHEYAGGISYAVVEETLRLGVEIKGDLTNKKHMIGPSIAIEKGRIYVTVSPLIGITAKSDYLNVQGITGIAF